MSAQAQPELYGDYYDQQKIVRDNDRLALRELHDHWNRYSLEFRQWLPDNLHVWRAFYLRAEDLRRRGIKRYSARALIYVLRYHSDVQDSDQDWKINDHCTPGLARVYNAVTGSEFFETREAQDSDTQS